MILGTVGSLRPFLFAFGSIVCRSANSREKFLISFFNTMLSQMNFIKKKIKIQLPQKLTK
jgi:hypothetical protein